MRSTARRHATALAVLALALTSSLCVTATAAAKCGQDYHGTPTHNVTPGGPPLAVGDSVLADTVPLLVRAGFEADGMVCRQMSQGLALIQARRARLPHLVVLALGTNGEVTPQQIDTALSILGPGRVLALVTPHGSVSPSSPAVLRAAAAAHPGQIILLDWDRLVKGHSDWLASDGVHLGGSAGIAAFAQLVASVLPGAASPSAQTEAAAEPGTPRTIQPSEGGSPVDPGTPTTIQPPPGHRGQPSEGPDVGSHLRIDITAIVASITAVHLALTAPW
jgi:hypothetical protein